MWHFWAPIYIACGKSQICRFSSLFCIFYFSSKFKFRSQKSGCDWLMSGWKIGGPTTRHRRVSCVAGFYFLGEILQQLDSPCKTACHRVFFTMKSWFVNFQFVFGGSPHIWYCERRLSFVSCLCFEERYFFRDVLLFLGVI